MTEIMQALGQSQASHDMTRPHGRSCVGTKQEPLGIRIQ
jgi:hypothetical protein